MENPLLHLGNCGNEWEKTSKNFVWFFGSTKSNAKYRTLAHKFFKSKKNKNMKWQREKLLIRTRRLWGWFRKYFKFGNRTTGTRAGSYFLRSKNLVLENSNLNKKLCEFMRENKKGVKIFFPILSHNFPFSLLFSYYLKSIFVKHFVILGISHFCGNTDTQICHKSDNNTNIWNSAAVFLGRAHCAESCLHL